MKTSVTMLLALVPALAQIRPVEMKQPVAEAAKVPASGAIPAGGTHISLEALKVLQTGFDTDLASFNYDDPMDVIGRTRGVYLSDYGVVFTTEMSPVVSPGITPMLPRIPDQVKLRVHQRKVERMPAVQQLMGRMMKRSAEQLALLPDNQQIVLVVRLLYLPYEDTQGLPQQIVMKGDKRSVLAGRYATTEE